MVENEPIRDVILQLAAMSGEASESAVYMLSESEGYITKLLWMLEHDNLVKKSDKDGTIGYRLSQSGKRYLKQTYPDRYSDYFGSGGIKNKVRLDEVHRQRYQRMSEVNALMHNLGAALFPGTKPTFDSPLAVEPLADESQSSQARYYTSFEIKSLGDESIKISGSRAMGLLRCRNGSHLIYHSRNGPIKWEEITEQRTRILIGGKLGEKPGSVMLGDDMECTLSLLQSNGGRLNRYYKVSPEHQDRMLFAPFGRDGELQLRFCLLGDWCRRIRSKLMSPFNKVNGSCSLMCDGFADEKTAVLFACEFDMVRLVLFKTGIELRKLNGIVYCFDFQADVLRRFFGENVMLRTISSREIAGMIDR